MPNHFHTENSAIIQKCTYISAMISEGQKNSVSKDAALLLPHHVRQGDKKSLIQDTVDKYAEQRHF